MHKKIRPGWLRRRAVIVVATVLGALGVMAGGTAYAVSAATARPAVGVVTVPVVKAGATFYGCVFNSRNGLNRPLQTVTWSASQFTSLGGCSAGYTAVAFSAQGAAGKDGSNGVNGKSPVIAAATTAQCSAGGISVTDPATGAVHLVCDGAAGSNGTNGTSYQPVTASATTAVSNRDDSGNNGNWAVDTLTRTASVTRHSAAAVSNCPSGAVKCWFYTGTVADAGTFATVTSGKSPNAGVTISGNVMGTVNGGTDVEFYAGCSTPGCDVTPGGSVPGVVSGDSPTTTAWVKQFFSSATLVSSPGLTDWSWTYVAPNTCEEWTDAYNNSDGASSSAGDITGVNACTS